MNVEMNTEQMKRRLHTIRIEKGDIARMRYNSRWERDNPQPQLIEARNRFLELIRLEKETVCLIKLQRNPNWTPPIPDRDNLHLRNGSLPNHSVRSNSTYLTTTHVVSVWKSILYVNRYIPLVVTASVQTVIKYISPMSNHMAHNSICKQMHNFNMH